VFVLFFNKELYLFFNKKKRTVWRLTIYIFFLAYLFVTTFRPVDSEVTFSVFEPNSDCLLPV